LDTCAETPEFLVTPLLTGPVCLLSQRRLEEPVRPWWLLCFCDREREIRRFQRLGSSDVRRRHSHSRHHAPVPENLDESRRKMRLERGISCRDVNRHTALH